MQQLLQNVILVFRNSGTGPALANLLIGKVCGRRARLRKNDPNNDPLFTLQMLARLGVQYDLADVTALILTPSIVTLIIYRDGVFEMEGTDVVVRACNLGAMWSRFVALLFIKPFCSTIARIILVRAMRKTLLGQTTIHGTSAIAAGILAGHQLTVFNEHGGAAAGS